MKGADVVMAGIVQYNDWLEEEVRATWDAETGPGSTFWSLSLVRNGGWVPVCVFCGRVTGHPQTQQLRQQATFFTPYSLCLECLLSCFLKGVSVASLYFNNQFKYLPLL